MSGPSRWVEEGARTVVVPGYPDDGREYTEITPGSDVTGQRVVVWFRAQHVYGRAVSDPTPGAHIDSTWSLRRQAQYWLLVVADEDLAEYLRAVSTGEPVPDDVISYAPITRTWIVPPDTAVPAPRVAGAGAA